MAAFEIPIPLNLEFCYLWLFGFLFKISYAKEKKNYVGNSMCNGSKALTCEEFSWVTVTTVSFDWLQTKSAHRTRLLAVYAVLQWHGFGVQRSFWISPDRMNGHVSMIKASLQVRRHCLWSNSERGGLHQFNFARDMLCIHKYLPRYEEGVH